MGHSVWKQAIMIEELRAIKDAWEQLSPAGGPSKKEISHETWSVVQGDDSAGRSSYLVSLASYIWLLEPCERTDADKGPYLQSQHTHLKIGGDRPKQ